MQTFYLILINLIVVFVGLFIHGDPPKHYYLIIYPIPIILMAYFLSKINSRVILLFYAIFMTWWMVSSDWYNTNKPYLYKNVKYLSDQILSDSNGREFKLNRVGEFDYFENNFANNYIYLLKISGAKINNSAKLQYTIYEDKNTYTKEE